MSQDFNLDLTNVEDDDSPIGAMPAGEYELQGSTWQHTQSKASGNRMIKVEFDVVGPNFSGRKIWEHFMLEGNGLNISTQKLRQWRRSMGLDPDVNAFGMEELESMMNVSFLAKVKVEPGTEKDDGTKYEDSNRIASYIPSEKKVASKKPAKTEKKSDSSESADDDDFDWDE
jgi:hypothetical protein|tara:strand:- start:139 stop:654 length:516 start_codon:yes stop_codon:yes gene_type:complete